MSDQLYRQQIIDHYRNPRNTGTIANPDFKGSMYNTSCGDEIEIYLKVKDNKVIDFKYKARGCAIAVSAASLLSEELIGMDIKDIKKLDADFIQELIGTKLTSSRIKCATLVLDAVNTCI